MLLNGRQVTIKSAFINTTLNCSCKTMVFETAGTSTPINNSSNLKQSGNLRNNNYRNGYRKSYNGTSNTNQTANQQTNRSTQNNRSNEYTSYNRFRNYKKMATPENKTETKMSADLSPVPKLKVLLQLNIVQDVSDTRVLSFVSVNFNCRWLFHMLMTGIHMLF